MSRDFRGVEDGVACGTLHSAFHLRRVGTQREQLSICSSAARSSSIPMLRVTGFVEHRPMANSPRSVKRRRAI